MNLTFVSNVNLEQISEVLNQLTLTEVSYKILFKLKSLILAQNER